MRIVKGLILLGLLVIVSCNNHKTDKTDVAKANHSDSLIASKVTSNADSLKTPFEKYPNAKFKIFYGMSMGYDSDQHRYGYNVYIVDSLLVYNFHSPDNEYWRKSAIKKSYVLSPEQLNHLKHILKTAKIKNKIPIEESSSATGVSFYRLTIETNKQKVDGYVEWGSIKGDSSMSESNFNKQVEKDKKNSTTMKGNYMLLINEIEKLFPQLDKYKKEMLK